ncbi:MAG TPA: TIGR03435 family protein [Vicinamibacterales bacterium]|nr:TIGR03435 family protein [Vicinamibacterales bacterium]
MRSIAQNRRDVRRPAQRRRDGSSRRSTPTLSELISFAYRVHAAQITGAPQWIESEKYDITAQPQAEGTPNERQLRAMVQRLLEERFKLTPNDRNSNGLPGMFFKGLGMLPALNARRAPAPTNDPNAPPGLFTTIQEQLGLRLDSTRAPVEVLVVDRVERPSDN